MFLVLPGRNAAKIILRNCGRRVFKHSSILEMAAMQRGNDTKENTSASTSAAATSSTAPSYEDEIRKFLASESNSRASASSSSCLLEQFHIQGWRWHTKSLVRDAGRLHRLALKSNVNNAETLKDASDYVIGFNLSGLHKIEVPLFFPWMREKLTTCNSKVLPATTNQKQELQLSAAFSSAMNALEKDRRTVAQLGDNISENVILACDTKLPESRRANAIAEVAVRSAELKDCAQRMMSIEDTLLVPAIGVIVPEKEQKSFNNRVLLKLGILDSRLHLVGMYEAVWEGNDSKEKELFQQAIPGISRQMIPRWKRKLYEPKTYMLE